MPDQEFGHEPQPREHRAGAWVLLVVGIAAFGLGLYQWKSGIVKAFDTGPSTFKTQEQIERERLEEMKTKDTDQDGISDFDETYVFSTSPYLADSDSDGFTDKEELESGNDPNCPKGKECGPLGEGGIMVEPKAVAGSGAEDLDPGDEQLKMIEAMLNPTPDQIRQLLIDSGVAAEDIEGIDDETLLALYQESLVEAQRQLNQ